MVITGEGHFGGKQLRPQTATVRARRDWCKHSPILQCKEYVWGTDGEQSRRDGTVYQQRMTRQSGYCDRH